MCLCAKLSRVLFAWWDRSECEDFGRCESAGNYRGVKFLEPDPMLVSYERQTGILSNMSSNASSFRVLLIRRSFRDTGIP